MVSAGSSGNARVMEEAMSEINAAASKGHAHARSVQGFLYGTGMMGDQEEQIQSFTVPSLRCQWR